MLKLGKDISIAKVRPGRGGTMQGKSVAGIEAWREALAFLEQHLQ